MKNHDDGAAALKDKIDQARARLLKQVVTHGLLSMLNRVSALANNSNSRLQIGLHDLRKRIAISLTDAPLSSQTPVPDGDAKQQTILVVDPDPWMRKWLIALFEHKGYRAVAAGDGPEGLRVVLDLQPDLITTEILLPTELAGMQMIGMLKQDPRTKDIPILLISSLKGDALESVAIDVGAKGHVFKPFRFERVLELVERELSSPGAN